MIGGVFYLRAQDLTSAKHCESRASAAIMEIEVRADGS